MIRAAGAAKIHLPPVSMATLAVLAGVFVALGAAVYTLVMTGADPLNGGDRMLGGVVFSPGLILVVVGGAELFTGNTLIVMAAVDRLVSPGKLLRNWMVVYAENFSVQCAWQSGCRWQCAPTPARFSPSSARSRHL